MTVVVFLWARLVENKRIIIFCDNASVKDMLNMSSSSCGNCMVLIRLTTFASLKHNVRIFAKHVVGVNNKESDLLSCMKIDHFKKLTKGQVYNDNPEMMPSSVWTLSSLWGKFPKTQRKQKGTKRNSIKHIKSF